jgi:hypothetical protein
LEEGPEPQELFEQTEHDHEKSEHEGVPQKTHMRAAITAANLAVLAALGSLLSGHAANQAILLQSRASDQWAYYQAKSTKGHLYEVSKLLINSLVDVEGKRRPAEGKDSATLQEINSRFDTKAQGYDTDKKQIEEKARHLEEESAHEFLQHQFYSFAIACFQIGIVLASVSILVNNIFLYSGSIVSGAIGIILLVIGWLK